VETTLRYLRLGLHHLSTSPTLGQAQLFIMKQLLPFFVLVLQASLGQAAELKTPGDRMFANYFKIETKR
ncbi:uncharacterized protein METZ01_LOCUS95610, partial [marine metagenome]